MRIHILLIALLVGCATACDRNSRAGGALASTAQLEDLLSDAPVVDGHNDLLIHFVRGDTLLAPTAYRLDVRSDGQTDIARWRTGRAAASFITVDGGFQADTIAGLAAMLDLLTSLSSHYHNDLVLARNSSDIRNARNSRRIALIPHIENGGQLRGSIDELRRAYERGVRSVGLVWNHTNMLADAAGDTAVWHGLSPQGEEFVQSSNCLGVLLDLSHASDQTALDVLSLSSAPAILSHSSARSIVHVDRNASDEVLRAVAAGSGVVMVTFVPYFTTRRYADWYAAGEAVWDSLQSTHVTDSAAAASAMQAWERRHPAPRVTLTDVADHFDHIRSTAGPDHVGIGSDFDGMYSHVEGLEDASTFPALLRELARRGWSMADLRKVAGENVLRVLEQVERVAAQTTCG